MVIVWFKNLVAFSLLSSLPGWSQLKNQRRVGYRPRWSWVSSMVRVLEQPELVILLLSLLVSLCQCRGRCVSFWYSFGHFQVTIERCWHVSEKACRRFGREGKVTSRVPRLQVGVNLSPILQVRNSPQRSLRSNLSETVYLVPYHS
jgi:hypothetical protein